MIFSIHLPLEGARVLGRTGVLGTTRFKVLSNTTRLPLTKVCCLLFSSAVTFSVLKNINFSRKIANLPFPFWDIALGIPISLGKSVFNAEKNLELGFDGKVGKKVTRGDDGRIQ